MSGHGWVVPNPDGTKARCGGPGVCPACSVEAAAASPYLLMATPAGYEPSVLARMGPVYIYAGVVREVLDADTLAIDIDMGFRTWQIDQRFRLLGCNAHEKSTEAGKAAKAYLAEMLPAGTRVVVRSERAEPKFGQSFERFLAQVYLPDTGVSISELLIRRGWAARWDGRSKPRPVPPWPREDSQR